MTSSSEHGRSPSTRVEALDLLSGRLAAAGALTAEMRTALRAGDAATIESGTHRLENLLTEVRVLVGELERLPASLDGESESEEWERARERFETTATALAREGAVSGGLLAGLVDRTRRLFERFSNQCGESYRADGRPAELGYPSLSLKELA